MNPKNIARFGWPQATSNLCKYKIYLIDIVPNMKAIIVILALWGWFPLAMAQWINRIGGKDDE